MTSPRKPGTKRVGLLTLRLHINYGGILQIAALYNFLAGRGWDVTLFRTGPDRPIWHRALSNVLQVLPFQNIRGIRSRHRAESAHNAFIDRYMPNKTRVLCRNDQLASEVERRDLDAFIVGSDQVWRRKYAFGSNFMNYFLDFVRDETRKISYAASFGQDRWNEHDLTPEVTRLLGRFDAVTVREQTGQDIVANTFGRDDSTLVLDPTLLMPATFYEAMLEPASRPTVPTLMKYVLDPVAELEVLERSALALLGEGSVSKGIYLENQERPATIPEWLRAFHDADFVLTDSFHGMAFSIIFRKQFVALVNTERGADRFISLAKQLGLEDRLITVGAGAELPLTPIDYDAVQQVLESRRDASCEVLLRALQDDQQSPLQ